MRKVLDGQCGVCAHFGEEGDGVPRGPQLLEVASTRQAPDDLAALCGRDELSAFHLRVTPVCGCNKFEPVGGEY